MHGLLQVIDRLRPDCGRAPTECIKRWFSASLPRQLPPQWVGSGRRRHALSTADLRPWRSFAVRATPPKIGPSGRISGNRPGDSSLYSSTLRSLHLMRRRELFPLLAALGLAPAAKGAPADPPATSAFDAATVRNLARELARKPYQPPDSTLPDE